MFYDNKNDKNQSEMSPYPLPLLTIISVYPMTIVLTNTFDSLEEPPMKITNPMNVILTVSCPIITSPIPLLVTMAAYLMTAMCTISCLIIIPKTPKTMVDIMTVILTTMLPTITTYQYIL